MRDVLRTKIVCTLWISFLLFSGHAEAVNGQHQPGDPGRSIEFQALPENFEFNGVRCILRDHRGFMWFGTIEGLVKFDGTTTTLYESDVNNIHSLTQNIITSMTEDTRGNLWIGTQKGLNLYDREHDRFIRIGINGDEMYRLSLSYISSLSTDSNGMIWVGTYGDGVSRLDYPNRSLKHFDNEENGIQFFPSSQVTQVVLDIDNQVWIGTLNGIYRYAGDETGFVKFIPQKPGSVDVDNINVTSMYTDQEGVVWAGTRGDGLYGIIKMERGSHRVIHYASSDQSGSLSNDNILSISQNQPGVLWVGTENGGLDLLDKEKGTFTVYRAMEGVPHSLKSNSIWSLFSDSEGRLWMGTPNDGIYVIDHKYSKFGSVRKNPFADLTLPNNFVRSFAEDEEGNIWIGTDGGGICVYNPALGKIVQVIQNTDIAQPLSNNAIQDLYFDTYGDLWAGTWAGGINKLDSKGKIIKQYSLQQSNSGGGKNVINIYEDTSGNLWVATGGSGLYLYNREADKFSLFTGFNTPSLGDAAFITDILEDSRGNLWIGSLSGLVMVKRHNNNFVDVENFYISDTTGGLSSDFVDVIFEDSKNRIWIGTVDRGLNFYDYRTGHFNDVSKSGKFPYSAILGILEDPEGFLWITTNRGLVRFNYDSDSIQVFTREDGLNSGDFFIRSLLQAKNGVFYTGGENGFNYFNPLQIEYNEIPPPVYLTGLIINNQPAEIGAKDSPLKQHIGETRRITLKHSQSSFSIGFVALNYTRPAKNQYAYMLDGFDEDWIEVGNRRQAIYTRVPSGRYVFKVRGSNNDGVWSEGFTSIAVRVLPPWWKTWWALVLYGLMISMALALALKIWTDRINIIHDLRMEKTEREREHALNETNIKFFTNISHEFRTPLSLILAPLESAIPVSSGTIRDKLNVAARNARRLLRLTNELMDFRKLEKGMMELQVREGDLSSFLAEISYYFSATANQKNIRYITDLPEKDQWAFFDPEKLETILINILANAFKYVHKGGEIRLTAAFIIRDNQTESGNQAIPDTMPGNRFIKISVCDNGPGIDPEDLPHVFEKFYRTGKLRRLNSSGTGIGLALTRGLTEVHRGEISVSSIPDQETCFVLLLPVDRHAYSEDQIRPEQAITSQDPANGSLIENEEFVNLTEPDDTSDGLRARILIVEDNDDLRQFLEQTLSSQFDVISSADGATGLEQAYEEVPDLIISDIVMPGLSGTELCRKVKDDIRTCHIPLILLTAKSLIHEQIEGINTGADLYITKPFNLDLLLSKVSQLIKSRRKLYAHFSQDVYIMPSKISDNELDQLFLQKVIDYIVLNIADSSLSVEALAKSLNLSRSNVYRKIKALTGKTIIEFIRMIRLKQAIKLMETQKFSLSEIAYRTGFTSPSYFTKTFRDQYGKPPSEYLDLREDQIRDTGDNLPTDKK